MNETKRLFVVRNGVKQVVTPRGLAPKPPARPVDPDDALLARLGFCHEEESRLDAMAEDFARAEAFEYEQLVNSSPWLEA